MELLNVYKDRLFCEMSRIRRNIIRRDHAYTLLTKLESELSELLSTDMESKLLAILRDIPSNKFQSKSSPEWETFECVFKSAHLLGIVNTETVGDMELIHFRQVWKNIRKNKTSKLIDFLNITQSYV